MKTISTKMGVVGASSTILLLWLALPGGGGLWPLLAVVCIPFLLVVCTGSRKQAIFCGLFTGIGHFLIQLYWIVFVLGRYGGLPLFLSVPALVLLSIYMALYILVFGLLARRFSRCFSPFVSVWMIPCAWVGLEWLRSFLFSGFPWMDLGYGFADVPLLFQSADIWGHYGLSFLILLCNAYLAVLIITDRDKKEMTALAIPVCLVFVVTAAYSTWRWKQMDLILHDAESITVGVVQGNVDQGQKWNPNQREKTVLGYVEQSLQLLQKTPRPDLLLWPETSLPFFPVKHPLLAPIEQLLVDGQVSLLAGAPWFERDSVHPETIRLYNSGLLFDSSGKIVASTSKSHLVPFGEYVPLKEFLPFIAPLVEAVGDFSRGEITNPPACKTAQIGVLICFESIFGEISRKWVDAGANILVNITNDAWYGQSSAPYQTLAMTKLRAVETRRSIVRSANTGFSGFIDPKGRVWQLSPLFERWQSSRKVQIMTERTLFVRGGYLFGFGCFIFAFVGCLWCVIRGTRNRLLFHLSDGVK